MMSNTINLQVNNKTLFGEHFPADNPKAVVVLVHGMGEHLGRYKESVIPILIENNYSVIAYDQFGHGKTEGKRGHTSNYDILLESLETVVVKANIEYKDLPVFVYGHSMGGNVVINYALQKQSNIKGVIATSPLLRLAFEPPKWKLSVGKFMLNILPSITLPSELDTKAISRDPDEVKRYENDTLVHDKISPVYSFPVFDAGEYAIENATQLKIPTLICHGTGDSITSHKASEEFANASKKVEIKLFEGGYHELHHDLCKEELLQTVINWLNSKL